jgi:uncharacterized protein YecE (DUF72 family)
MMKKTKKTGSFFIGTSNIALPIAKKDFPPPFNDKSRLHYYSKIFNSIEINSSFYKLPKAKTLERWSEEVTGDFTFTLKLWKEITHAKELACETGNITRFFEAAASVRNKGCLLLQFPGKITLDYFSRIREILTDIESENNGWRLAIEFRHPGWHSGEAYELANEFGAGIVLHDQRKSKNFELLQDAPFYYFRYHGPQGDYRGSYAENFLTQQGEIISDLLQHGKDVYSYFNNTMGSAHENALMLKHLEEQKRGSVF